MQKSQQNYLGIIASGSTLILILVALLCPATAEEVSAASPAQTTATPAISLGVAAEAVLDIMPTQMGEFTEATAQVSVGTTSTAGYKLYMTTDNSTGSLIRTDNNPAAIQPITTERTAISFENNAWGYHIATAGAELSSETIYQPIPKNANTPIKTVESASDDTYDLSFGAKVNLDLPAGEYSTRVFISAVANPIPIPSTIDEISTMQEMTPEICQSMEAGKGYQLKDARDQKIYNIVRRSKDNKCWMAQNLAYEFHKDTLLTPEDTDVESEWAVPTDTLGVRYNYPTSNDFVADSISNAAGAYVWFWDGNSQYYYTWGAATAESGIGIGSTTSKATAPHSICAQGWRLPTEEDFQPYALNPYEMATTYFPTETGAIYNGKLNEIGGGGRGHYWTATHSQGTQQTALAYVTWVQGGAYSSIDSESYSYGISIRCVAK